MGNITKIKCENCGYDDSVISTSREEEAGGGTTTLFSRKTKYIVKIKNEELHKQIAKYSDKEKGELTPNFEIKDIKCPKCGKKEFRVIKELET